MLIFAIIRRNIINIAVLISFLLAGAGYSLWLGVDRNFDILNYHLYVAFALVEWRYDVDLFPASFHNYFNPLIDVPYYLVQKFWGLYYGVALQGTYFGLLVFVVWKISWTVLGGRHVGKPGVVGGELSAAVAATLIGVTGAAAIGQAGTAMNEVQIAVLVLLAIWIMLRWVDRATDQLGACCAAGLLLGSATALKLTAAVYAPGIVIAILIVAGIRRSLLPMIAVCAGWLVAFAALYGWWGYFLYTRFESPTFPLFNGIFKSSWLPPSTFFDVRFGPKTLTEYLIYPYIWAFEESYRASELSVRDPRLLISLVSIVGLLVANFFIRVEKKLLYIMVFFVISYACWLQIFAIYRYTIPLEALSGILMVSVIALATTVLPRFRSAVTASSSLIVAAFLFFFTVSPDWGHVPLHASYRIEMKPVPDKSLVVIVGAPAGYLATLIPGRDLRFAGVGVWAASQKGGKVHDALMHAMQDKTVSRVAVIRLDSDYATILASFGVQVVPSDCSPVQTSIDPLAAMISCPLIDLDPAANPAGGTF